MTQADVDDDCRPKLSSEERAELVALRRNNRVLELKVEIPKRASAYFAGSNVPPKCYIPLSWTGGPICRSKCVVAR
jgi:hypothetical protein